MSDEVTQTMDGGEDVSATRPGRPGLVLAFSTCEPLPRIVLVDGATRMIGREPPPGGFAIAQAAVSRTHAIVTRRGQRLSIRDLGSRNGTFVDDVKLTSERQLEEGDVVRLGDSLFVFSQEADAHAALPLAGGTGRWTEAVGGLAVERLELAVESAVKVGGPVLVLGETGSGKELAARGVHRASGRRGAFVALNCAALPATLIESELFGVERGAFTGAEKSTDGLIRAAAGGTLFLDEIGDMPLEAQAKLLRVVETGQIVPVGATKPIAVDFLLVSATHRPLREMVRAERFRADLLARIEGSTIELSPLRERKEDLFALASHFARAAGRAPLRASVDFMRALLRHDWPMNVRELANVVRRAVAAADGNALTPAHLPKTVLEPEAEASPRPERRRSAPDEQRVRALLSANGGNVAAVARELDCFPAQLHRWLKKYAIDPEEFRPGSPKR